jgi:ribonuclease BN (tRNA processing enzyme)
MRIRIFTFLVLVTLSLEARAQAIWELLAEGPKTTSEKLQTPQDFRIIFLGTAGPQMPLGEKTRSGPSQLLVVDQDVLMIDCGPGATTQLARSGIDPWRVGYLLFTHIHHYDHISDYPALAFTKWLMGASRGIIEPLYVFGPKGTGSLTKRLFEEVYGPEIADRSRRRPWMGLKVKEVEDGVIWQASKWRVRAVHVPHGPNAFAYRVEAGEKAVVVSGDIGPLQPVGGPLWKGLIDLAQGADILIIDALHPRQEQIAHVAQEAGVKTLVLSHFQGGQEIERIRNSISKSYKGKVIVAQDLMTLRP